MNNNYLSKEQYLAETAKHKYEVHWSSAEARWLYHQKTIEILGYLSTHSVLEAGTMGICVNKDSDTIDIDLPGAGWPLYYKPTYNHDLRILPWPVKDKQYNIFIALRVFHHLRDKPKEYLKEMFRISNHIILAFPESTASIYRKISRPMHEIHLPEVNTVILYYDTMISQLNTEKNIKPSVIKRVNNLIYKTVFYGVDTNELIEREIFWLKKLELYDISPKFIKRLEDTIIMTYCGEPINENDLRSSNTQQQLLNILRILLENYCYYNDFSEKNLLMKENKLRIIDFSWCSMIKEDYTCNENFKSNFLRKPYGNVYNIFNIIKG